MKISTLLLLLFTMTAFAANSILCRLALSTGAIGPVAFTAVRLGSGMLMLLPIILFPVQIGRVSSKSSSNELLDLKLSNFYQPLSLFGYAIFFSLAYVQLDTAVGALILFPTVQISMVGWSIVEGNRVSVIEWFGFALSFVGLLYLLSPGLTAPPLGGTLLMIGSGVCWSVYSLLGKKVPVPILATARNFLYCLPAVIILMVLIFLKQPANESLMTQNGLVLAILSGAVASALGYVLWYLSLRRITTTAASISQLVVPIFAAMGGIIFLKEDLTLRLVIASLLILGGITIAVLGGAKKKQN